MFCSIFYLFNVARLITFKNDYNFNNFLFSKPSELHLDYINKLNLTELPLINDNFAINYGKNNSIIKNYYFSNYEFRKVRLTYFKSDDKVMFNSVFYPSINYDCPILSVDLINFGENKSLCFINLFEIYNKSEYHNIYIKPFEEIKKLYPELSESKSKHLTEFNDILGRAMLYSHVYDSSKFNTTIYEVLNKYFEIYTKLFIKKPVNRQFIEEQHQKYNNIRHNIELNFITKDYFDELWYNRLLRYFYYN